MASRNKRIILIALLIFVSVVIGVSLLLLTNIGKVDNVDRINRGIDTLPRLLFNGYLGQYFNFKYFGLFNWLIIPFAGMYLYKSKNKLKREELAVIVVYLLAAALIAIKGYFNTRYQATLFPFTIFFVVYFLHHFIKVYDIKINVKVIAFFVVIALLSIVMVVFRVPEKLENKSYIQSPYPVIGFIENNFKGQRFFNNELSFLYYYNEDVYGVYYNANTDTYYSKQGKVPFIKNRSIEQISSYILDTLKCNYILSFIPYNKFNPKFEAYLHTYTLPIYKDEIGFIIYEPKREALPTPLNVDTAKNYLDKRFISLEPAE